MGLIELSFLALGLAMDAFAVAVCLGLNMKKAGLKKALVVGLYFGFFQAAMPVAGFFAAKLFADKIQSFDHWIAFALLTFLGVKMLLGGLKKTGCSDRPCPEIQCTDRACPGKTENKETPLIPRNMIPFAVATSIDALAVGISLAFLNAQIIPAAALIGIITLGLSMAGVKIGNIFGIKLKSKAEILGGVILFLIGVKIVLEHCGVIAF